MVEHAAPHLAQALDGLGLGELSYAHYITLFPEERFCVLLDNAHNLPLHLAVELGLPAALLLCGGVLAWLVWSRPWRETDPVRQLAWGVVAVVGLHSLLEYPLWYGPFQVTTLFALVLLCWRRAPGRGVPEVWRWLGSKLGDVTMGWGLGAAVCLIGAAVLGMAAYQYRVVSQLYKPVAQRPPALRDVRAVPQPKGVLFSDQVRFAWLTTQDLTPANAAQMHAVALDLLHFSPEPRVIEKVVDGALALGRADEAALHQQRYRIAYPADFARWQARRASAASAAGAP
ncbi:PglL family O-oligosaccharyltransferase [Acidovorax temperans]|uniref:PglL family O-oligosaccharyltransferase n=1 Tax=Acidovorax temperans TaxID=80878 RepID=UPI0030D53951